MGEPAPQLEFLPGAVPGLDERDIATINRFATWVGGDATSIKTRVVAAGVDPVIERQGLKLYRVADLFRAFSKENEFQRRARIQADLLQLNVDQRRGELCQASDVRIAISRLMQCLARGLETQPDVLEKKCGLTAAQAAALEEHNAQFRDQLVSTLQAEFAEASAETAPVQQEASAAGTAVAGQAPSTQPAARQSGAVDAAVAFLRTVLAGGPKPSVQLFAEAEVAGISASTLKRAKAQIGDGIESRRSGRGWIWQLAQEVQASQGAPDS